MSYWQRHNLGKIDDRLQVLVGGFIKLSAAAVNQMNIQDAASKQFPGSDNNKMNRRRHGGLRSPRSRNETRSELVLLPGNLSSWRGGRGCTADPRPRADPGVVKPHLRAESHRSKWGLCAATSPVQVQDIPSSPQKAPCACP
jgi:hypothetical protein